jgi:hypothetical protein
VVEVAAVVDLEVGLDGRADALAVLGEALGRTGVSVEGGSVFTVGGRVVGHFLVGDGDAAERALTAAGLPVTAVRPVLARRLDQQRPGELGAITRALAGAGVRVDTLYSDHDHRLILLTSDQAAAAAATSTWDR